MTLRYLSPLHRATRQVSLHLEARMKRLGLKPGEGHLLAFLLPYGPCAISELVRVFGHKRSTLTSMLDRAEKRGLVTREINPGDRRSFLVELTPDGRRLAAQVDLPLEELEAAIDAGVSPSDLAGFRRVMKAISQATGLTVRATPTGTESDPPHDKEKP